MARIWVADTCALLQVRRCVVPDDERQRYAVRKRVFAQLGALVDKGRLVFPAETYRELREGHSKIKEGADQPFEFVKQYQAKAKRNARLQTVARLVANPLVRRVVDPSAEKDEADIYVLSLALDLRDAGHEVGVITQERKDLPSKLSMATACGILELICLPMEGFLHQEGIWHWRFSA